MSKRIEPRDYIYASARVRAVEKNMLSRDMIEKMLDAKTAEEAVKVLYECEYEELGAELESADQFNVLLSAELKKTYDFVTSIAPDPVIFNILRYNYDYHNIKTLLKSEFLGKEEDDILMDAGTVAVAKLRVYIRDRNLIFLTEKMRSGIGEVLDVYGRTGDPQMIDLILDRYYFEDIRGVAQAYKNGFIDGYLAVLADTANLKSLLRVKKMNKGWDFFKRVFVDGGLISEKIFFASFDEPLEQFAEKMGPFGYGKLLFEGAEGLRATGKFTRFEKLCDDTIIGYIRKYRFVPYGIEPLFARVIAKEFELKTARIILAGKLGGLSSELLRERVRDTYV